MIINHTQKTTLAKNPKVVSSFLGKALGLMFSRNTGKTLIFVNSYDQYVPLHMFFVFYAIDVIYCNANKEVVDMKQNFMPFTIYNPSCKARYVIELPAGTIEKTSTSLNDKLSFK